MVLVFLLFWDLWLPLRVSSVPSPPLIHQKKGKWKMRKITTGSQEQRRFKRSATNCRVRVRSREIWSRPVVLLARLLQTITFHRLSVELSCNRLCLLLLFQCPSISLLLLIPPQILFATTVICLHQLCQSRSSVVFSAVSARRLGTAAASSASESSPQHPSAPAVTLGRALSAKKEDK